MNYLSERLDQINELTLRRKDALFMYPLYVKEGEKLRKTLLESKIYVPILWPDVFYKCDKSSIEYDFALNILPLPIDQRYGLEEMDYIITVINSFLNED